MAKRKANSQIGNLTPDHSKLGIDLIYSRAGGVQHVKSSQQGLQICFRPHLNPRFAREIMGPQSCKSFNFDNFGTPTWESRDKMSFGCGPRGEAQNIL